MADSQSGSRSDSRFVYVTYIQTTPQKVWAALFDPEMTRQYWSLHRNVSDWKVGSDWKHVDSDDESKVGIVGKVLEAVEPRRLVLTWAKPAAPGASAGDPAKTSRVTIEIEPQSDAVKLTVLHEELDEGMYCGISNGWPVVLSSLKTMLETGKPLPMTTRRWTGKAG